MLTVPWYILMAKYYNNFIHFIIISPVMGTFLRHEYIYIYILLLIIHVYKLPTQPISNILGRKSSQPLVVNVCMASSWEVQQGFFLLLSFSFIFKWSVGPKEPIIIIVPMHKWTIYTLDSSKYKWTPKCCRIRNCAGFTWTYCSHIIAGTKPPLHNRAVNTTAAYTWDWGT